MTEERTDELKPLLDLPLEELDSLAGKAAGYHVERNSLYAGELKYNLLDPDDEIVYREEAFDYDMVPAEEKSEEEAWSHLPSFSTADPIKLLDALQRSGTDFYISFHADTNHLVFTLPQSKQEYEIHCGVLSVDMPQFLTAAFILSQKDFGQHNDENPIQLTPQP